MALGDNVIVLFKDGKGNAVSVFLSPGGRWALSDSSMDDFDYDFVKVSHLSFDEMTKVKFVSNREASPNVWVKRARALTQALGDLD